MTRSGTPRWTVDTLDVTGELTFDDLGREWVGGVDGGDKGWIGSAKPRTTRQPRPEGHGAFRSVAYREPRVFTLGGYVHCPDWATREKTELELAGLCSDPGQLYEFRRRTDTYDLTAMVELDDEPLIEMVSFYSLRWSYQFAAPDPRKHDHTWQDPIVNPPAPGFGGLEFSTPGLEFDLDFGVSTTGPITTAQVANFGSAPSAPLFKLTGPMLKPSIVHVDTGRTIRYTADLVAGEVLRINCDEFPQRGVLPHERVSTLRGNVASLCTIGTEWPVVNPRSTGSFQLQTAGTPAAELMCSLRSAWY